MAATSGCSPARTTASASRQSTRSGSSRSSSGCTLEAPTRARASAWPWSGRSLSTTAAGSGWTPRLPGRGVRLRSPCRRIHPQKDRTMTDALLNVIDVLLVEDDPGDVLMTREAFEQHKVANHLHVVTDGVEATKFLGRQEAYADAPRPGLILLDLNLPRKDGREVLADVKADPELCDIPIVVLTTSAADEDILRSYQLHANAYVTKPVDFNRFVE